MILHKHFLINKNRCNYFISLAFSHYISSYEICYINLVSNSISFTIHLNPCICHKLVCVTLLNHRKCFLHIPKHIFFILHWCSSTLNPVVFTPPPPPTRGQRSATAQKEVLPSKLQPSSTVFTSK